MKIFLTGAAGGLGAPLCDLLLGRGHSLLLLTRRKAALSSRQGISIVHGDLRDPASYAPDLRQADALIHMAALTHTNDVEAYFAVNEQGTRDLVQTAEAAGLRGRFLFVSTRACGEACGAYGASKAAAEEAVRASALDWSIVRPGEVYGAAKGEAISKAIEGVTSSPFALVPGSGRHKLAPVALADVLSGVAAALERPEASRKTYVLAGPEEFTYVEFLREVMRAKGVKKPMVHLPMWLLRLAAQVFALFDLKRPALVKDQIPRLLCEKNADIDAARRDLGFEPARLAVKLEKSRLP